METPDRAPLWRRSQRRQVIQSLSYEKSCYRQS
jgi:hypothetical protein